ncbi:DUF5979 domain-containing protein [Streptomyces sp. NPDC052225]|uniref:DUF5979 domain-containing protein n=1 Tax=Streptomyces sp. NPDC052225 TaxID=3154949 RepID=UPI003436F92C
MVGGDAGPYSFTLSCTTDEGDVPLADADRAFSLSDGETRTIGVPQGAACTVQETDVPSGDTVTYKTSDGGDDGDVTVSSPTSVDITNTFEPDHTPDHGDKGHLADTGTWNWTLFAVLLAALALTAGAFARRSARRP